MTGRAKRLKIGEIERQFGVSSDGLDVIDFKPAASAAGTAFEAVTAKRGEAKRRPATRARNSIGMSKPSSHNFASEMNGTRLEQSLGVYSPKEVQMEESDAARLKRMRKAVATYGFLIFACRNPLQRIQGNLFEIVERESRKVIDRGSLARMEKIAFDLCQNRSA